MNNSNSPTPKVLTLDDLIALNDEICGLVRAGVPLELGLHSMPNEYPTRLKNITNRLADKMSTGLSLAAALDEEKGQIPGIYRAVVSAGIKSGRLPEALESLSESSRSFLDLRQKIRFACIYPGIVLMTAYFLFLFILWNIVPSLSQTFEVFRLPEGKTIGLLETLAASSGTWWPIGPLLVLLWGIWSFFTRESRHADVDSGLGWLPGIHTISRNFNQSRFAELSALLLERGLPLHESITLAAEATGDFQLIADSSAVSKELQSGHSLSETLKNNSYYNQFLQWMLILGEQEGQLATSLRQVNEIYRRKAFFAADWVKVCFPVALVVVIGGGATMFYALTLFLPITDLLTELSLN